MKWKLPSEQQVFFQFPELAFSGHIILTDCYVVNRWWLAICMMEAWNHLWWKLLDERTHILTMILFKTAAIWFAKKHRKPPDEKDLNISHGLYDRMMVGVTYFLFFIEDLIYFISGYNIDLSVVIYVTTNVIMDYFRDFLSIFIAIQFNSSSHVVEGEEWLKRIQSIKVPFMEVNQHNSFYFRHKRTITSNVVLSMSTKSKQTELNQHIPMDSDSYLFAVDTCTSENICKHEELFIGDIKPCKNVFVQGVRGKNSL